MAATSVEVSQTPFERDERDWDWWEEAAAAAVVAAGSTWVWVASFSAGVATPRPSRASEGELLCAVRVKMCSTRKITKMQFVRGSFLPEAVGFAAAFAVPATAVVAVGSVALVVAAAASAGSAGRPASPAASSASFARSARAQTTARRAKGGVSATGLGSVSAHSEGAGQAAEEKYYIVHVYYPVAPRSQTEFMVT